MKFIILNLDIAKWAHEFVRSVVLCGQGSSLLLIPRLRPFLNWSNAPAQRERRGFDGCVCVCVVCALGRRESRLEQLVMYF